MSTDATTPDTIVLIHGFWVTPRRREDWKARYESRGFRVLTPAYPGFEVEVEALNADPTPIEDLTVPAVVEHLESVVSPIEPAPILMGHSAGGVFTQLLMDRGYGAAGVAINSAPTEGVKRLPVSQIRSSFPVLKNPANRHKAVGFTFEQWRYVFTNTFSEEEARRLYERYHIPASGRVFWGSALANIHPGPDDTHVDYKNPNRAPLLFISGSEDHLMPPSIQRSNAKHYKAGAPSPRSSSTRAARISCPRRPAGRRSPTTRSSGQSNTPRPGLPSAERKARHDRARPRGLEMNGLSFERDLKPLFRERDRATMLSVANFDLWNRDDVADNSQAILTRLEERLMPCDEAWPDDRVETFRRWVEAGMPA
jgi:pimeloyl-ACP methyl ester carboxylesterase